LATYPGEQSAQRNTPAIESSYLTPGRALSLAFPARPDVIGESSQQHLGIGSWTGRNIPHFTLAPPRFVLGFFPASLSTTLTSRTTQLLPRSLTVYWLASHNATRTTCLSRTLPTWA